MLTGASFLLAPGCASKSHVKPNYSAPLPAGSTALRPVDPQKMPNLEAAWRQRDSNLIAAIDESKRWYLFPSSERRYPYLTSDREISHSEIRASTQRFSELLQSSRNAEEFRRRVMDEFQVYESVGWNGDGIVLFTGYYAPEFNASLTRTPRFKYPIHRRPDDLVTHPESGLPLGQRQSDGSISSYPTRREIEESGMLDGTELAWLESPLDAYVVHVNGSAKLILEDGEEIYIGYDGKTNHPYTGLGAETVREGLISADELSLSAIYELHEKNPDAVKRLILRNDNFVFFTEYDGGKWPSGSLGVKVHPRATLATDKAVYPAGSICLVETDGVNVSGRKTRFLRFMVDQDTGGAIKAPGRADIYMGEGEEAESLAGGQYAEGRLYYLFLK